jgi:hypothetical protein
LEGDGLRMRGIPRAKAALGMTEDGYPSVQGAHPPEGQGNNAQEYSCPARAPEEYYATMATKLAKANSTDKRRRSKRLPLSIPVRVYGRTPKNVPFRDITSTKLISAHGGLLPLAFQVKRGQTLVLVNSFTGEERECRVVYTGAKTRGKKQVALEFTANNGDFWHVYTVLADSKITPSSN